MIYFLKIKNFNNSFILIMNIRFIIIHIFCIDILNINIFYSTVYIIYLFFFIYYAAYFQKSKYILQISEITRTFSSPAKIYLPYIFKIIF